MLCFHCYTRHGATHEMAGDVYKLPWIQRRKTTDTQKFILAYELYSAVKNLEANQPRLLKDAHAFNEPESHKDWIHREWDILLVKRLEDGRPRRVGLTWRRCRFSSSTVGCLSFYNETGQRGLFPYLTRRLNGLMQERRNSSALAMELRLSCTNPLNSS